MATNQRTKAAVALLSVAEVGRCIQLLAANQMLERAMLLADAAEEAGLQIEWDKIKGKLITDELKVKTARTYKDSDSVSVLQSSCAFV